MNSGKFRLKNNFVKNIVLVTGGATVAQLLNTVLSPLITRIYSPDQYGDLSLYTSILSIMAIVSSLKYEHSISIADNKIKAINAFVVSLIVLLMMVGIVIIFTFIFSEFTTLNFNFLFLIPVGILATGMYKISMQWAIRERDFIAISKTKLTQSIFSNITKIGLGLLNFGSLGLIIGNIIGGSSGIRMLSHSLIKDKKIFGYVSRKRLLWATKRFIKFPIYLAPSQILNTTGVQMPIFYYTFVFGSALTGNYGLAFSIVSLPMTLIGNSVGDVFYGEAAKIGKKDPGKIKNLSLKLLKKMIYIGGVILIILVFFGPLLFKYIFGEDWYIAGEYARILGFLVFFRLIFMPISRVFEVFEKQNIALRLDIIRIFTVIIIFTICYIFKFNSYFTLSLYCFGMCLIYLLTFIVAQGIMAKEINHHKERFKSN